METREMWDVIVAERLALAKLLAGLDAAQWEHPSACPGWRVRDVAAHLIAAPQLSLGAMLRLMPSMLRHGYNGMVLRETLDRGGAPVERILEDFSVYGPLRRGPALVGTRETLTDVLVHTQDILRPLGITRAMPSEAAREVADRLARSGWFLGARPMLRAVRMEAVDCDWSAGSGPLVRGPIDELVLLRAGRPADWPLLSGEGVAVARDLWERRGLTRSS